MLQLCDKLSKIFILTLLLCSLLLPYNKSN